MNTELVKLIKKAGSQRAFAKLLNVPQPLVVYWVHKNLPLKRANQIAKLFNIDRNTLIK